MASGSSMDSDDSESEINQVSPLNLRPSRADAEVQGLQERIENDLFHFESILESWRQRADELDKQRKRSKRLPPHSSTLADKLREVQMEISSSMLRLPARHNPSKGKSSTPGIPKVVKDGISGLMLEKLRKEFENKSASPIIQGVRQLYARLDDNCQKCLLCLTAFPENAIIKKRVLINWWDGEELLNVRDLEEPKAIEKAAEDIFKKLGEKGFIRLVHKKGKQRSPVPDSCQLHPFMRRVLITLAKKANFLGFDSQGNEMTDHTTSAEACMVEVRQSTLFNVNEQFLGLRFDSSYARRVLQLGRWVVSPDHGIDVDDAPSLTRVIGTMKRLRYLSLQGVTKIGKLPASICKLNDLTILDLGACQSLETLPEEIGSLKELRYLDFSECYLINHMPKSLKKLVKLQVLKGFLLHHSVNHQNESKNTCTLSDLAEMEKLWKLSLRMDKAADLGDEHRQGLSKLPELRSLTITWIRAPMQSSGGTGGNSMTQGEYLWNSEERENSSSQHGPFPCELMKLDLRNYPGTSMPTWVTPSKAKKLKKLYIRGGNLANLNSNSPSGNPRSVNGWSIKILRLKYLANCEIEWLDLRDHFPYLVYLEKFQCPKLKFFPCDSYGVWMDPHSREEDRQFL